MLQASGHTEPWQRTFSDAEAGDHRTGGGRHLRWQLRQSQGLPEVRWLHAGHALEEPVQPTLAQGHRRPLLRTLFFMLAEVHKTREDEKPREEDGSNRRERLLGRQLPGAGLLSTSESTVANSTKMRNVAAIRPANGDISTA
jgi:hypothetical protein